MNNQKKEIYFNKQTIQQWETIILVCSHKEDIVLNIDFYLPIQVGKAISDKNLGFIGDDTGDNISKKNKNYCELTGIYWAWKNLHQHKYIGLCHYRRYFNFHHKGILKKDSKIITSDEMKNLDFSIPNLDRLFKKYDIILPKPRVYPYNLSIEYSVSHNRSDYKILEQVISELSPEYLDSFHKVFNNNKLPHYNMFIMKKSDFDQYCTWLFKVLFEVEKRINITQYDAYQSRVFGFLSERLQYIYVHANNFRIKSYPIYFVNNYVPDISFFRYLLGRMRNNMASFIMKQNPSSGIWKILRILKS